jgi:hypothetical protein
MKRPWFFAAAGLVLACVTVLTGCPQDAGAKPDSRLINTWENGDAGELSGLYKYFTINEDYTFTVSINVPFIETVKKIEGTEGFTGDGGKAAAIAAAKNQIGQGAAESGVDAFIADMAWNVTGKLTIDDGEVYIMSGLEETSGKPVDFTKPDGAKANAIIKAFSGQKVEIKFLNDNGTSFSFQTAQDSSRVDEYFGGTYREAAE